MAQLQIALFWSEGPWRDLALHHGDDKQQIAGPDFEMRRRKTGIPDRQLQSLRAVSISSQDEPPFSERTRNFRARLVRNMSQVVSVVAHPPSLDPSSALRALPSYTKPQIVNRSPGRPARVVVLQIILTSALLATTTAGWVLATVHLPPDTQGAHLFVHLSFAAIALLAVAILLKVAVRETFGRAAPVNLEDVYPRVKDPPPTYERRGSRVGLLEGVQRMPSIPEMAHPQ